jgi:hypothetical protein
MLMGISIQRLHCDYPQRPVVHRREDSVQTLVGWQDRRERYLAIAAEQFYLGPQNDQLFFYSHETKQNCINKPARSSDDIYVTIALLGKLSGTARETRDQSEVGLNA